MKQYLDSNSKIKYFLLSTIFSILFIFTALYNPIVAHAEGEGLGSVPNGAGVNAQEVDSTSTAGNLFWAASGDRTGIMVYIVDDRGQVYKNKVVLIFNDRDGYNKAVRAGANVTFTPSAGQLTDSVTKIVVTTPDTYDSRPVYYANGWQPNGDSIVSFLTADSDLVYNGQNMPYWFKYAKWIAGGDAEEVMNAIMESSEREGADKWTVAIEPISCQYIYNNDGRRYEASGTDILGHTYSAGDPKPYGDGPESSYSPYVYVGSATYLSNKQVSLGNPEDGAQYTYKFLNMALPWGLCLAEQQQVASFTGGTDMGGFSTYNPPSPADGRRVSQMEISLKLRNGLAIAFIDVRYSRPPLHTFDGTNTPGNTETPDPGRFTTGECTVKKLYYTETINADGTVDASASPDYHNYTQTGTTSYISIDPEEDYEIVGWKTTTNNNTFTSKVHFITLSGVKQTGDGAGIVKLRQESDNEKYLYVLYKKTVVNENPQEEWDFQLLESQITKRVSFTESTTTSALLTNQFKWKSVAHTPTSCNSHGGYGHHLNCSKTWDTEPVAGVAHTCTESCPDDCSVEWDTAPVTGVAHTHGNSCYDTPCSNFQFTDKDIKLGITLDTASINKAVISKRWSVIYNDSSVNTIISNKHYGEFERTTSAENTMAKAGYNLVAVLFRGQDHLTLAQWKNNAAGKSMSYLTDIAYDSSYNFKAANTPQGARKAGEEYTETTGTKFVNRSPDRSTTYYATVGAYGKCGSTKLRI